MTESTPIEKHNQAGAGLNPHYRAPVPRWHAVALFAPEGTECGVLLDEAGGLLAIAVRPAGTEWLEGRKPATSLVVQPGFSQFIVENDDRGPAVGHVFAPDPADPSRCTVCEAKS